METWTDCFASSVLGKINLRFTFVVFCINIINTSNVVSGVKNEDKEEGERAVLSLPITVFSLSFVATRQIQTSHQLLSLKDWWTRNVISTADSIIQSASMWSRSDLISWFADWLTNVFHICEKDTILLSFSAHASLWVHLQQKEAVEAYFDWANLALILKSEEAVVQINAEELTFVFYL